MIITVNVIYNIIIIIIICITIIIIFVNIITTITHSDTQLADVKINISLRIAPPQR